MEFVSSRRKPNKNAKMMTMRSTVVWMGLIVLLSCSWILPVVEASAPVPETEGAVVSENEGEAAATQTPKLNLPKARFVHKTIIIPHDEKKFRGGEDAASTIDTMIVVADGVGGWAKHGVNPGLYSRKLTETITSRFAGMTPKEQASVNLRKLVHESNHIAADVTADGHLGSATCTVVRLQDANTLETVNVGDSGYSIHRKSGSSTEQHNDDDDDGSLLEVVYASIPGQKGFNFPYQLGGKHGDQVEEPNVTDGPNTHALQNKDVIVVVSDGIIDNIDPHEYHDCIARYQWDASTEKPRSLTELAFVESFRNYFDDRELVSYSATADCIARKAYFLGKDPTHQSPFARSAAKYGKRYLGGKHDDITVVVAQVELAIATANDNESGEAVFVVDPLADDPHKSESVFVYKDSDGDLGAPHNKLPTMDDILRAIMDGSDIAAASAAASNSDSEL